MTKRMPTEIDGRPVHLKTIDGAIDATNLAATAWETMCSHIKPGVWWSIRQTKGMSYGDLHRAGKALYMRIYARGMSKVLQVRSTEEDGICFYWTGNLESDEVKQEMRELYRKRLDKKLKLNKNRLDRIQSEESTD